MGIKGYKIYSLHTNNTTWNYFITLQKEQKSISTKFLELVMDFQQISMRFVGVGCVSNTYPYALCPTLVKDESSCVFINNCTT